MTTVDTAYPPRLAAGIELLGELKDSGFAEPRSLIRRADGQVIQLSRMLYLVSCLIDGARGPEEIASAASAELGRTLTAEQVRYLITAKLARLGIVAGQGAPAAPTASPLLGLEGTGHAAPRGGRVRGGDLLPAAVPLAGDRGRHRQRRRPRLLALLDARAGSRAPPGAERPGGPAGRGRPVRRLRPVPRVRARGRVPVRRGAAWTDRGGHLPGVSRVLHQRHRLLPAQQSRPPAHRPRRPVLQHDLHAGARRLLRGDLGGNPPARHRPHAPGDAGATAAVRPLRRVLHPERSRRSARPVRPRRSRCCAAAWPGGSGIRAPRACAAAPGS